eukprot:Ihof_evm1s1207 gene=Ihof_evmTU1s1207
MSTKVYIGNLSSRVERKDLWDRFERHGKLTDVWLSWKPPGFGFVWYEDSKDAEEAVHKTDKQEFNGRRMKVELSIDRSGKGKLGRKDIACKSCGIMGHAERDCPDRHHSNTRRPTRPRSPHRRGYSPVNRSNRRSPRRHSPSNSRSQSYRRSSPARKEQGRRGSRSPVANRERERVWVRDRERESDGRREGERERERGGLRDTEREVDRKRGREKERDMREREGKREDERDKERKGGREREREGEGKREGEKDTQREGGEKREIYIYREREGEGQKKRRGASPSSQDVTMSPISHQQGSPLSHASPS